MIHAYEETRSATTKKDAVALFVRLEAALRAQDLVLLYEDCRASYISTVITSLPTNAR